MVTRDACLDAPPHGLPADTNAKRRYQDPMFFLGNPASVHLAAWRKLYAKAGVEIEALCTVHPAGSWSGRTERVFLLNKVLSYILLGIRLRFADTHPVHAHGASGYGLSAWISGRPYIVTIYGSELLGRHSWLYRTMVRAVLRGAAGITVTSGEARRVAQFYLNDRSTPVFHFHTGIDTDLLSRIPVPKGRKRESSPTRILSVRNTGPVYRTREIIQAVDIVWNSGIELELIIPFGNGDPAYRDQLKGEFSQSWITWIDDLQTHEKMLSLIAEADVCINFPMTDQLSTTLLEVIYFDRALVTVALPAYEPLFATAAEYQNVWRVSDPADLLDALLSACRAVSQIAGDSGASGAELVHTHYDYRNASASLKSLLDMIDGRNS